MNAFRILRLYVGACLALLFTGCSNESNVATKQTPSTSTQEPRATIERSEPTNPPSMMSNIPHSLEDCQIFSTCACAFGEDLPKITLNSADSEQCRAGKQMLDLGDMTQACAIARRNLKTLLKDNSDQAEHLGITIPSSCTQI